jgi:hypothetical protein
MAERKGIIEQANDVLENKLLREEDELRQEYADSVRYATAVSKLKRSEIIKTREAVIKSNGLLYDLLCKQRERLYGIREPTDAEWDNLHKSYKRYRMRLFIDGENKQLVCGIEINTDPPELRGNEDDTDPPIDGHY